VGDDFVQFNIDGKLVRIPRAMLHSYRVYQGKLHFRFTGGMILAVAAPGNTPLPDSDWAAFPPAGGPAKTGANAEPLKPNDSTASAARRRQLLLRGIEAQQRAYRELQASHQKRMQGWFSAMEQAKKKGVESTALTGEALFETQRLANALTKKLTSQQDELARLEQYARQASTSNDNSSALQQCLQQLRGLEKQHDELVALSEELDQNLLVNYRTLRGY
jgi:hypothetical protein